MGYTAMQNLRDLLCKELDTYKGKDKLGMSDLEIVNKLTDTIKNIDKIEALEEGYAEADGVYPRYDRDGNWNAQGSYDRGNSYGRHYVRGHYSMADDPQGREYARRRGYSRDDAKMEIVGQIEDMMSDASGQMREILRKAKAEIERA